MKQLLTRIEGLEKTILLVIDQISSLKEENEILSSENNRLHIELNQLRRSSMDEVSNETSGMRTEISSNERDIKIDPIKNELDRCIEEVEECLRHL